MHSQGHSWLNMKWLKLQNKYVPLLEIKKDFVVKNK